MSNSDTTLKWEPIETASPEYGIILVYDRKPWIDEPDVHTAAWHDTLCQWVATPGVNTDTCDIDPTHWLPGWRIDDTIPPPPEDEQSTTQDDKTTERTDVFLDVLANLVAAVSLLKRGGKKAAASDKMFDQMIKDYERSIARGRAVLQGETNNDQP